MRGVGLLVVIVGLVLAYTVWKGTTGELFGKLLSGNQ